MSLVLPKNVNLSMPPEMKNYKNFLVEGVLLLIAGVLFFWFVILPKQAEVQKRQDALTKIEAEEVKMADSLAKLQAMVKQLQTSSKEISQLDQAIPLDSKTPKFQILLEGMANSVGLTIGGISISTTKNDNIWAGDKELLAKPFAAKRSLQKISGSIYVIGSYEQLKTFLNKLETSGRIINITSIGMDAGADNTLNLKLGFDSFYLAP